MGGIWFLVVCSALCWLYLLPTFTPARVDLLVPFVFPLLPGVIGGSFQFWKKGSGKDVFDPARNKTSDPACQKMGSTGDNCFDTVGIPSQPRTLSGMAGSVTLCLLVTFFLFFIQGVLTPFINTILSRFHEVKLLNDAIYPVVHLFGLNPSISEGVIHIPTFKNLLAFPGLLEKLNLFVLFYIFTGGIFVILVMEPTIKNVAKFSGILLVYAYVRYLLMFFIYAQFGRTEIYWQPAVSVASFFPLAFFLAWLMPVGHAFSVSSFFPSLTKTVSRDCLKTATLFFITIFSLTGFFLFHDPGIKKQGRILVNENHSNWEWSTKKFDTTWYGRKSTYNYYCMVDYFDHYYDVDQNLDQELSSELLSDYDVLIIKTPTEPYQPDEIESLVDFVEKGGGLWLIGDHTNVFGMSYYINFIAKKFGLFFHYDSTYDLKTGRLSVYTPPGILAHPIVRDMPPFLFATSCTLDAPLAAEDVITGYGLRTRLLSYSGRSFFHEEPTTDYEFGLFLQGAAVKKGRGRVAAFTDSTCFSNFYMFIPGKPELAMGTMEWLNRENRFGYLNWIFMVVFIGSSLFIGVSYKRAGRSQRRIIRVNGLFVSLVAFGVGLLFFTSLNKANYQRPEPHTDFKSVAFDSAHSNIVLPVKKLVDKEPNNYHTFYVWTQRLDYFPTLEGDLRQAVKNDMVVIINPTIAFSDQEEELLKKYVHNGGKLLFLDDPQNRKSTSNQVLKGFGMEIVLPKIERTDSPGKQKASGLFFSKSGKQLVTVNKPGFVKGGQSVLDSENGKACFSLKQYGKGIIGVMADSFVFANKNMGGTQIVPNEKQKQIYRLEYLLFQAMEVWPGTLSSVPKEKKG